MTGSQVVSRGGISRSTRMLHVVVLVGALVVVGPAAGMKGVLEVTG